MLKLKNLNGMIYNLLKETGAGKKKEIKKIKKKKKEKKNGP